MQISLGPVAIEVFFCARDTPYSAYASVRSLYTNQYGARLTDVTYPPWKEVERIEEMLNYKTLMYMLKDYWNESMYINNSIYSIDEQTPNIPMVN